MAIPVPVQIDPDELARALRIINLGNGEALTWEALRILLKELTGSSATFDDAIAALVPGPGATADALRAALVARDQIGVQGGVLPAAFAQHFARVSELRRRKGGVIGINGKSAIAFAVSHQLDQFKATVWPAFRDRGMPVGWGAVTRAVGSPTDPYEPTTATWDDVRQHYAEGAEVWSHSHTHLEPAPLGPGLSVVEEIRYSRQIIKAEGLRPVGWQYPGVASQPLTSYYYSFMSTEDYAGWSSETGINVMINYPAYTWAGTGHPRFLPTPPDAGYGLGYITMDDKTFTQAKALIDRLVDRPGTGMVLGLHPAWLGMGGRMSFADFTATLDYIKSLWDAGTLEVLTQSGLSFADPNTSRRMDLLLDNNFEGGSVSQTWGIPGGTVRSATGGNLTPKALSITADGAAAFQQTSDLIGWGANGMVCMFEAMVKNTSTTAAAEAVVRFESLSTANATTVVRTVSIPLAAGATTWEKVRFPVGIPMDSQRLTTYLTRGTGSATVAFDEVHLYAC